MRRIFAARFTPASKFLPSSESRNLDSASFEIHLPDGDPSVSLVSGKPRVEGPQLEGHAPKASMQAFLPNREVTADRAVVEWVVRAPKGTRLALTARADRAGVVRTDVSLD